jgi:dihydroneopterin aldolase
MSDQQNIGKLAGQARMDGTVRDRIFVQGLVLPVAIGAYDEEQGITQKVRFSIEAAVASNAPLQSDELAHVPSYDDLVKAVRAVVAEGHIKLVETMAERIAERCLSDKRIASVLVRVEKLERGPASVGVEIVRPRTAVLAGDLTHLKR